MYTFKKIVMRRKLSYEFFVFAVTELCDQEK